MPRPRVIKPTILSPGIGLQHFPKFVITLEIPSNLTFLDSFLVKLKKLFLLIFLSGSELFDKEILSNISLQTRNHFLIAQLTVLTA